MNAHLDADALALACRGGLWRDIEVVASTGSTNADLADAARAGAEPGLVRLAEHQSAGRGRLARTWEAPPGASVACSALVAPARGVEEWGWLSLLVGMAVVDGVRAATGVQVGVKWPNDVGIHGRKLCGILCESVLTDAGPRAVLGFGLNTELRADELPVPTATSLRLEGSDAAVNGVVAAVLQSLETWYTRWDAGADLGASYRQRCTTIGEEVSVQLGEERVVGTATGVAPDGALVVATAAGERTFVAGDVTHLRPA
ncbi:biotin--[acetyl-CoA-carboxylase] ligase [Propioniciclava soli]|uniref:biotin--[acetyl-CoA-carboxylase] ligase n=1 Tax=Propioniciclava soli TaxID=2775081 RepID=UPI001E4048D4